jgi:hypothetical protein
MDDMLFAAIVIPIASAGGAWLKAHEQRISAAEAVIQKLDTLTDLLIEEKLSQRKEKTRGTD